MELLFKVMGICMLSAILSLFLKEQRVILGVCIILGLVIVIVPALLRSFREILDFCEKAAALSSVPFHFFEPLLKIVGISFVVKIGTSICKEAGSDTASALLEMAGVCCAVLASLPLMEKALQLLGRLL